MSWVGRGSALVTSDAERRHPATTRCSIQHYTTAHPPGPHLQTPTNAYTHTTNTCSAAAQHINTKYTHQLISRSHQHISTVVTASMHEHTHQYESSRQLSTPAIPLHINAHNTMSSTHQQNYQHPHQLVDRHVKTRSAETEAISAMNKRRRFLANVSS